jgi:hypothetical protein
MTRALGLVQPGWGNPNHGRHTVSPSDSMERHQGPRAPSVGKPAGQGKGMRASPAHNGVAQPKAMIAMVVQGRVLGGGGAILHGGGGMGQQPLEAGQGSHRYVHCSASYQI